MSASHHPPLVVLVAGEPLSQTLWSRGGFGDLIRYTVGDAWTGPWRDVDLRGDAPLPTFEEVAGLVITGSPASVTDGRPWMARAQRYLSGAADAGVPTLGICFGHQLLAAALGGRVERNPLGREMGTVPLEIIAEDPVLGPGEGPRDVNMTHVDSAVVLPAGARILARTEKEPHAAVRFGPRVWGVQFHPEIDGEVMRHYIEGRREQVAADGGDPDALLAGAGDAPGGAAVLRHFAASLGESNGASPAR